MRKILFIFTLWFSSFVSFFIFLIIFSVTYTPRQQVLGASINLSDNPTEVFSSLPQEKPMMETQVIFQEAKNQIIKNYLAKFNTPEDFQKEVDYLVARAEEYGVDPKFIVAIARKESSFCKNIAKLPDGSSSNNCGGLGIYGGKVQHFDTIHDWVDAEIRFMADNYIKNGITDPCEIEKTHTPPAKGVWCAAINAYISEMQ